MTKNQLPQTRDPIALLREWLAWAEEYEVERPEHLYEWTKDLLASEPRAAQEIYREALQRIIETDIDYGPLFLMVIARDALTRASSAPSARPSLDEVRGILAACTGCRSTPCVCTELSNAQRTGHD